MEEIIQKLQKLERIARRPQLSSIDLDILLEGIREVYDQIWDIRIAASTEADQQKTSKSPPEEGDGPPSPQLELSKPSIRPRPTEVYEPGAAALAHPQTSERGSRDIRKLISLNERFGFVEDLFGANLSRYQQVLDRINQFHSYEEAIPWLEEYVHDPEGWKDEDPTVKAFYNVLQNHFSSAS